VNFNVNTIVNTKLNEIMNYQGSPDRRVSGGLIAALLFIASATTALAQTPEIRKAFRYQEIEQPSKMIPALEKAAQGEENLYYLGLGYIKAGDLQKALSTFEKGIAADDKNPLPVAGKGHVKLLEKKTAEGKALLVEAADMNRKKTAAQWEAIGRAYLSDSKFLLDAISALEKGKALDGGDPDIHMLLGDAYLQQNQGGQSVSSYERAASADQTWALPLYKIAKVYQRSRNNDIVMDYLQRAVKVDPEFAPAYKELGEAYYLQKKAEPAVDALKKYISISENPGEAKFQLAFFLIMAKKYDEANAIFKEVLNDKNASSTAYKFYARSLLEQKKLKEAQPVFEKYFKIAKPEEIQASDYAAYGKLLLELKQDSLANEAFAKGIALDTANQEMEIRELNAKTLYSRKKYKEAANAYKELIKTKQELGQNPSAYDLFYKGHAYYLDGQYLQADSAFTQLSEVQPNSTLGFLYAAKARAQHDSTGTAGTAVPMYEKFVELAVEDVEKNKKELIDAYDYLGQYAIHKSTNQAEGLARATDYFQKILKLDPKNERALEFMQTLKEMNNPQRGRGK
jgi:tetratricopeptide (TPR) repeat protein